MPLSVLLQVPPTATAVAGASPVPPTAPMSPLVIALVVAIIIGTVFAWLWAVRRPTPIAAPPDEGAMQAEIEKASRPFVYAAIGASDVVGLGARDPEHDSWVSLLAARMPAGTEFARLGRSGITLNEALKVEIPAAVAAQPDLVTIWNCVNDAVHGIPLPIYLRDLRTALDTLTGNTDAHIIVLNLPDLSLLIPGDPTRRALVQGGVRQWNAGMAGVAASYGDRVVLLDLFPLSSHLIDRPELISMDSFHPSTEGYRWLAETVWNMIEQGGFLQATR